MRGSVPEMRIWSIFVIKSDLKWCIYLSRSLFLYTNGKKKQCIAKMLITHKICSGWAWKFMNMVSPIRTFNYQTFTRFHVLLVRHLFFLWKLHFMSSATEKQHATKLIDAKRKFMERMIRKPLYFCYLVRIDDVTPSWKLAFAEKCNMQESNGLCWQYLIFLDYLRLSVQNVLLEVSLSLK